MSDHVSIVRWRAFAFRGRPERVKIILPLFRSIADAVCAALEIPNLTDVDVSFHAFETGGSMTVTASGVSVRCGWHAGGIDIVDAESAGPDKTSRIQFTEPKPDAPLDIKHVRWACEIARTLSGRTAAEYDAITRTLNDG